MLSSIAKQLNLSLPLAGKQEDNNAPNVFDAIEEIQKKDPLK